MMALYSRHARVSSAVTVSHDDIFITFTNSSSTTPDCAAARVSPLCLSLHGPLFHVTSVRYVWLLSRVRRTSRRTWQLEINLQARESSGAQVHSGQTIADMTRRYRRRINEFTSVQSVIALRRQSDIVACNRLITNCKSQLARPVAGGSRTNVINSDQDHAYVTRFAPVDSSAISRSNDQPSDDMFTTANK